MQVRVQRNGRTGRKGVREVGDGEAEVRGE